VDQEEVMAGAKAKAEVGSLKKSTNQHFNQLTNPREVSNMPQKDRTGPQGQGPKTGRGMGKCGPKSGFSGPQGQGGIRTGRGQGRGSGRGAGRGQGSGRGAGQGQGNGRGAGQGRGRRS
jgi:hypothetical protein